MDKGVKRGAPAAHGGRLSKSWCYILKRERQRQRQMRPKLLTCCLTGGKIYLKKEQRCNDKLLLFVWLEQNSHNCRNRPMWGRAYSDSCRRAGVGSWPSEIGPRGAGSCRRGVPRSTGPNIGTWCPPLISELVIWASDERLSVELLAAFFYNKTKKTLQSPENWKKCHCTTQHKSTNVPSDTSSAYSKITNILCSFEIVITWSVFC